MYRNNYSALMLSTVESDFTSMKGYYQITMKAMHKGSEDVCTLCNTQDTMVLGEESETQANGLEWNMHETIIQADGLQ